MGSPTVNQILALIAGALAIAFIVTGTTLLLAVAIILLAVALLVR